VGVLQPVFSSSLGTTVALSLALLSGVILWRATSFIDASHAQLVYVAPAAPSQVASPEGADWQQELVLLGLATTTSAPRATTTDHIAMIGPMVVAELVGRYAGLVDGGVYSPQTLQEAATTVSSHLRAVLAHKTYGAEEIKTDENVSYERMLQYRSDLREALLPLLQNTGSELEIYGKFVETGDPSYLAQLSAAAENYRRAAENAARITIPRDAMNYHLDILNAMQKFGATLDALSRHSDDALASAALLRTFNESEERMYRSFNALSAYYSQKSP